MKYAKRFLVSTFLISFWYTTAYENLAGVTKYLTFNDLKHFISFYESTNGKYKYNKKNKNGTVDCGIYQVNSVYFKKNKYGNKEIVSAFDSIFTVFRVSKNYSERVIETIRNDSLCSILAECIYEKKGITQWASYCKFEKYIEGYRYHKM